MATLTETQTRSWDLTHLLQFLPAASAELAPASPSLGTSKQDEDDSTDRKTFITSDLNDDHHDNNHPPSGVALGDFSKVWQFLGAPIEPASGLNIIPSKVDYASDGATYQPSVPAWQASIPNFHGKGGLDDKFALIHPDPVLSPQQNRTQEQLPTRSVNSGTLKEQKKARQKADRVQRMLVMAMSESECDSSFSKEKTPARKASSHPMVTRSMVTRSMSAKIQTHAGPVSNEEAVRAVAKAVEHMDYDFAQDTPCPKTKKTLTPVKVTNIPQRPTMAADTFTPQQARSTTISAGSAEASPERLQARPHVATPNVYKTNNLIPSSIQPVQKKKENLIIPTGPKSDRKAKSSPTIAPITLRSGEDRDYALLMKLIHDFGPDRKHLVKPMNMTTHNNDPSGLHVFIDASNIFIGFVDQLKRSRNIHPMQQVPDVHLSFDSLALLIERRRPVAKRVLVGSTPHVPAFDKAKAVGYECSILEKVYKARELSDRQIYFKEMEARRYGRKSSTKAPPPHKIALAGSVLTPGNHAGPLPHTALAGSVLSPRIHGSGSETNTPKFAAPKLVEQGVDEILHLKMLESILDAEKPGTIVLATGDAACAEYSSGFAAMVERALRFGWNVELTSWSKNISSMYKQPAWTAAWGDRFRIIELDEYAEELLDM